MDIIENFVVVNPSNIWSQISLSLCLSLIIIILVSVLAPALIFIILILLIISLIFSSFQLLFKNNENFDPSGRVFLPIGKPKYDLRGYRECIEPIDDCKFNCYQNCYNSNF